jgi:hypothetical protein
MLGMTFTIPIAVSIQYDYLLKGGQINVWFFQLLALGVAVAWLALRPSANSVGTLESA